MKTETGIVEESAREKTPKPGLFGIGGAALFASVAFCAASHLIFRGAASSEISEGDFLALLFDLRIIGGLLLYALGTGLWLFCLSRLDLSVAFPASALQLLIVYGGARWILGEEIPPLRLVGAAVILVGIALLFLDGRRRHV